MSLGLGVRLMHFEAEIFCTLHHYLHAFERILGHDGGRVPTLKWIKPLKYHSVALYVYSYMDPKSLASNTATLLGLTTQVTGVLYGDWDGISRPTVDRLLYELARLRTVLVSLEEASLLSVDPILPDQLVRIFRTLRETLLLLASKLLGDVDTGRNLLQFMWEAYLPGREPRNLSLVSKSEGEDLISDLQVQTTNLRTAIDDSIVGISVDSNRTEPPETLARSGLWEYCGDYNGLHKANQESRVKGSGMWLLSHAGLRKWMTSERIDHNRQENVLYCVGRPGSGKTILASAVIDELKIVQRDLAANFGSAYFYFSYRTQTPIYQVVLALVEQFYLKSRTVATEVQELEKRTIQLEPRELPLVELITVLMSVAARFRRSYIVLDALDECSSDHRADLGTLIGSIRSSQCRLFVTTRPSHGLNEFDQCPMIPIAPSLDDMTLFVRDRLQRISAQRNAFTKQQESQITDALVKMGSQHGMFLLVELQINGIAKSFEQGVPENFDLEKSLERLTGKLDEVYANQISRISAQHEADSNLATHILSWLYYNTGSMKAVELEDILRKEVEAWENKPTAPVDNRFIRKVCLDLVRYNPDVKVVSFFHFSFHEYLETRHKSQESVPVPEMVLAESCMKYLLQPELSKPAATPEQADQRFRGFPFYKYSALNWSRFLGQGDNLDFEAPLLKSLLMDSHRMHAILEAVFRDEPRFWQAAAEKRSRSLHFITYFGLLRAESGVPSYLTKGDMNERDFLGRSALHIAAMMGHLAAVQVLLASQNSVRIRGALTSFDDLERNVLHYAALGNHWAVAEILLERLAHFEIQHHEVVTKDSDGMTPLSYGAARGHAEIVRLFLEKRIYDSDAADALLAAAKGGHAKVVEVMLSHGIVPKHDHLLAAIDSGAENTVKLLLEYGVDISSKAARSALHEATQSGKKPIMSSLIWNGADLETTDSASRTPLSLAVENGDIEAVRALLRAGSNPEVVVAGPKNMEGETTTVQALSWAAAHGMVEIFSLLRRAGTDSSAAFFPAIENGQYDIVYELLESGMASELVGDRKTKAIMVAQENGHEDVAYLVQNWDVIKYGHENGLAKSEETTHKTMRPPTPPVEIWSPNIPSANEAVGEARKEEATTAKKPPSTSPLVLSRGVIDGGSGTVGSVTSNIAANSEIRHVSTNIINVTASTPSLKFYREPPSAVHISSKSRPRNYGKTPYIQLESPIREGCLELGSLVQNPRKPLDSYAAMDPDRLSLAIPSAYIHVLDQSDFEMHTGRSRKASAGFSVLTGGLQASLAKNTSLRIQSPHVRRVQLRNQDEVLRNILKDNSLRKEWVPFLQNEKEVYMVVGLFIMERSRFAYDSAKDSAAEASLSMSASVGIPMVFGPPSSGNTTSAKYYVEYNERLIHGIQYRALRRKTSILDPFRSESKRPLNIELGEYAGGPADDSKYETFL